MKNLFLSILTVLLGAIVISSCEKLKTEGPVSGFQYDTNSQIDYSKIKNQDISAYRGGSGCGEILVFDDMETFKHALNELERQVEEYDDAFVAHYFDLSEEELYQKEQEIGYNDVQPMIDFENYLDFRSSNADYLIAEKKYLAQDDLNDEDDPDNHFIAEDEERSLLNTCNEVMINDTIYKLTQDGYFVISDGDLRKLAQLDDLDDLPKNVNFIGGDNFSSMRMGACRSGKRKSGKVTVRSKRIKWVVTHRTYITGRKVTAKTKNFKKRRRCGWRKYRTKCSARVYGYVSGADSNGNKDCDIQFEFNWEGHEKTKNRAKKVKHKMNVSGKTRSGWVKGAHSGAGGIIHYSTLYFN